MPTFSKILPNMSSKIQSIFELFSEQNFKKVAKEVYKDHPTRERKFDFFQYVMSTISMFNTSHKVDSNVLTKIHAHYKANAKLDENAKSISDKCVHKNICQDRNRELIEQVASDVLGFVNGTIAKSSSKLLKQSKMKALLKTLNLSNIILIDGTEVESSKGAVQNLGIKAKGRKPKADDDTSSTTTANPCFKLHIAYSVIKQSFEYIEITGGVDSERDRV